MNEQSAEIKLLKYMINDIEAQLSEISEHTDRDPFKMLEMIYLKRIDLTLTYLLEKDNM